ncbi:uncharacterized protein LOC135438636 [Drosophila montana]|uniref:uncharacterized protein LOC135438636 n=1 Tax=Drosophila montana TaxID=40370 RepID=UPI00313D62F8
MDFTAEFEKFWAYLNESDNFLHIPLLYVVIPLACLTLLLLNCCCFCCLTQCCEETEVRFVPRSVPTLPARRNTADIIRPGVDNRQTASGSRAGANETDASGEEQSATCVELDENVVDQVNAMYKKRNYRVPK